MTETEDLVYAIPLILRNHLHRILDAFRDIRHYSYSKQLLHGNYFYRNYVSAFVIEMQVITKLLAPWFRQKSLVYCVPTPGASLSTIIERN